MKVLITGAAGFIGSQLAHELWKRHEELILVDDFSYGSKDNLIFDDHDFNDEIVIGDVRDKNLIDKLMCSGNIDYVYHIAGIAPLPDCQSNPQNAISVNVEGTVNILEHSRKYGVKKIVFASTNAMYENETDFPTKENSFTKLPTLIYPNTKYVAERFCESYCKTYGMNITCLRFANVYGPHIDCLRKQPPLVGYMIKELFYNRTPIFHSNGEQRRDYIYVKDLINLAIAVRNSTGFDCVNVSSNQNYSVNELYKIACKIMNKNMTPKYHSSNTFWVKYPQLYDGAYSIKSEILEHEVTKYSLCDNSYAKEKYNWVPQVTIEEGLKKSIDYEISLLEKLESRNDLHE
ncbi:MAG: NAD-dependent epimerase/dehydratase family protein [Bacilli bacterium]|nr:NAD-dependent epimerase/dehydratase family protein [Bacilli bacterium]